MTVEYVPFDYASLLETWHEDPTKSVVDNMLSMIESYSDAYRLMATEIRRLEAVNLRQTEQVRAKVSDYSELQKLVDCSITNLDPDRD